MEQSPSEAGSQEVSCLL